MEENKDSRENEIAAGWDAEIRARYDARWAEIQECEMLERAIELLREYEQWEADIISEDKLWWPNRDKDFFSGPLYDKMLELQAKRNAILKPSTNSHDPNPPK